MVTDYTFLGWSTKRGQTRNPQYQAYETIKVTRNMHLYPVRYRWSQEPDINVKNLAANLDQYSRIIFVGDSRTVMMGQTLIGQYQNSVSDKVSFICKGRQGLAWMKADCGRISDEGAESGRSRRRSDSSCLQPGSK